MKTINPRKLIKTWEQPDQTKVSLLLEEDYLIAEVCSENGDLKREIPSYEIELPQEIKRNPQWSFSYVQDSYIRIIVRRDGSVHLQIHPRLRGGGWWDSLCSVACIIGGGYLIFTTGGLGVVGGSALLSAGINGLVQGVKTKENFSGEFLKSAATGALTGAVMGGAVQLAGPIANSVVNAATNMGVNATTRTVVEYASHAVVNATTGALVQVADSYVHEGKLPSAGRVLTTAFITGALGTVALGPSSTVAEGIETTATNLVVNSPSLVSCGQTVIPAILNRIRDPEQRQELQTTVNELRQERDIARNQARAEQRESETQRTNSNATIQQATQERDRRQQVEQTLNDERNRTDQRVRQGQTNQTQVPQATQQPTQVHEENADESPVLRQRRPTMRTSS